MDKTNLETHLGLSKDGKISFHILTKDRFDGCLDVLNTGYHPDEPLSILYGIADCTEAKEELNHMALDIAKDGVSVIGVDDETGKVVGALFNKIQVKPKTGETPYFKKFKEDKMKNEKAIKLVDFMLEVDGEVDILEEFKTDKAVEFNFLGVLPTHRHRGIGRDLVTYSIEAAKAKKICNVACLIGSSRYTIMIAERLGFQKFASSPIKKESGMDDATFETVTKVHDKWALYARKI